VVDAVDDKLPGSSKASDGGRDDGDVGEHAEVGGTARIDLHEIQGVGVKVHAGLISGDGLGVVVRLHVGEVLTGDGSKTGGVLVEEGDVVDGGLAVEGTGGLSGEVTAVVPGEKISTGTVEETSTGSVGGGVTGSLAKTEHERLDAVGETDVVLGGSTNGVAGDRGGLHLLDGNVPGGLAHKSTLLVGDNSVVGPDTSLEEGEGGRGGEGGRVGSSNLNIVGGVEGREELGGSAHGEVDAHVVVGKGSSGEGDSGLPGEEEGEGKLKAVGDGSVKSVKEDGILSVGGGGLDTGTDHGVVTGLLGGRDTEGGPEIELGGLDLHGNKVVEGDGDLLDKVVHQVLDPEVLVVSGGGDDRGRDLQPGGEKVISGTGDSHRPGVSEIGSAGSGSEHDRDLGEPSGLDVLTDEVSDSILSTVKVGLEGVKGGKIDEGRSNVRCIRRHFIIVKKTFLNNELKKHP
jgi:hypothetical protein